MIRTQVSFTEKQYQFLKEASRQTGESLSSMVRRAIENLRRQEFSVGSLSWTQEKRDKGELAEAEDNP